MASGIEFWDSTLREGEQQQGVHFSLEEKKEIGSALFESGLAQTLEIHCYEGYTSMEARELAKEFGPDRVVLHHRSLASDIEVSRHCGAPIAMYLGVSDIHLATMNLTREAALKKIEEDLRYAAEVGVRVRKYTLEDATRADASLLREAAKRVEAAGVEALCIADTVGSAFPDEYGRLIEAVRKGSGVQILAHCHNDLGLALANCLSAYQAGVRKFNVSVLGLGERCGITRTEDLATAFRKMGLDIKTEALRDVCETVAKFSGIRPNPHDPVVGENAFSHKAGVHARKILENPSAYEPYSPEIVGRSRNVILSGLSGKSNVLIKLKEYGITEIREDVLTRLTEEIRKRAYDSRYDISESEFEEIASKVLNVREVDLARRRKTPRSTEVVVFVDVKPDHTAKVARSIRKEIREAGSIAEITGEFDLLVNIKTGSISLADHYVDRIRAIDGVDRTLTSFVLKRWR
ncbi:MAG: Lrp/AsnC ligand binding domain-containing protein [Candidatus Brockarchaeota archaeon]|nr:Lrp/AsnC ligand binding domain-containing protein [Candidatus Brockarchaeota archaeon]